MKNQRTPYFEQPYPIGQLEGSIEKTAALIREVIPVWQTLSNQPLTIDLLQRFTNGDRVNTGAIELLLKQELAAAVAKDNPHFDQAKILSMMKIPDIDPLVQLLDRFGYILGPGFRRGIFWNCFTLEGDQVNIITDQVERQKDLFREYAATPDQVNRLAQVQPIIEAMEQLRAKYPDIPAGKFIIYGLVSEQEGRLMPSPMFVNRGIFNGGSAPAMM